MKNMLVLFLFLTGCSFSDLLYAPDGAVLDSSQEDSRTLVDSDTPDSSLPDSNIPDTGIPDSMIPDTGTLDTGVGDTGVADSGTTDTGTTDSGTLDTGVADTGVADTGVDGGWIPSTTCRIRGIGAGTSFPLSDLVGSYTSSTILGEPTCTSLIGCSVSAGDNACELILTCSGGVNKRLALYTWGTGLYPVEVLTDIDPATPPESRTFLRPVFMGSLILLRESCLHAPPETTCSCRLTPS